MFQSEEVVHTEQDATRIQHISQKTKKNEGQKEELKTRIAEYYSIHPVQNKVLL